MSNDDIPGYEAKVFNSETLSPAEVSVKGKKFILALYGGQMLAKLDEYMYYAYNRNIASKSIGAIFTLAALSPGLLLTYGLATRHACYACYAPDTRPLRARYAPATRRRFTCVVLPRRGGIYSTSQVIR